MSKRTILREILSLAVAILLFVGIYGHETQQQKFQHTYTISQSQADSLFAEANKIFKQSSYVPILGYSGTIGAEDAWKLKCIKDQIPELLFPDYYMTIDYYITSVIERATKPVKNSSRENLLLIVERQQAFKQQQEKLSSNHSQLNLVAQEDLRLKELTTGWIWSKFLIFALTLLVIRHITMTGWQKVSPGGLISFLLATITWPIGLFTYKPENSVQKMFDQKLQALLEKYNGRSFGVTRAYIFALWFVLGSLLMKPISTVGSSHKFQETITTCSHVVTYVLENLKVDFYKENFPNNSGQCVIKAVFRNWWKRIRKLLKVLFNKITSVINLDKLKLFLLSKLLGYWLNPPPPFLLVELIPCTNGIRAPSFSISVKLLEILIKKRRNCYDTSTFKSLPTPG